LLSKNKALKNYAGPKKAGISKLRREKGCKALDIFDIAVLAFICNNCHGQEK